MNQPEAAILLSSGNQDHTTTILATASGSYKNRVYINSPLTLDLIRLAVTKAEVSQHLK